MSASPYYDSQIRRPFASVASAQTDSELWPAEPGRKLRVLAAYAVSAAPTSLTFNRKSSGASGTAISPAYSAEGGHPSVELDFNPAGWFETNVGQSLTCTTGAGAATAITLTVASVPGLDSLGDVNGLELLLEDGTPLLLESA